MIGKILCFFGKHKEVKRKINTLLANPETYLIFCSRCKRRLGIEVHPPYLPNELYTLIKQEMMNDDKKNP